MHNYFIYEDRLHNTKLPLHHETKIVWLWDSLIFYYLVPLWIAWENRQDNNSRPNYSGDNYDQGYEDGYTDGYLNHDDYQDHDSCDCFDSCECDDFFDV